MVSSCSFSGNDSAFAAPSDVGHRCCQKCSRGTHRPWCIDSVYLFDFVAAEAALTIRRSAGIVRVHGEGATMNEGSTNTDLPRKISLDAATVTLLASWQIERGETAPQLARPDALIFGDLENEFRDAGPRPVLVNRATHSSRCPLANSIISAPDRFDTRAILPPSSGEDSIARPRRRRHNLDTGFTRRTH